MLGHRELTIEDYAGIFRRRFRLILLSAILLCIVSVGVSLRLQPRYESQTLILVEQQKVPEDYVKPVVAEDLGARLSSMKEQILSRSRLEPIITKFNLFPGNNNTMDDRVDLTRKAIKITQIHSEQSRGTGGMPGFFVSFVAQDAHTAQQVCGEITSLFVSENLSAHEQSAEGTTDFLKQQLAESKAKLDEQDAKLADFQRKYIGKLPGQESSNVNTLQVLTTQLDAATQAVNRIQENESFLQAMIAQQTPESHGKESVPAAAEDEEAKELKSLTDEKRQLEALYTPDHPDLVAINRKIAELRAERAHSRIEHAPSTEVSGASRPESSQLQQLKAQLHAAQQSLIGTKQEQDRIGKQIRDYESRVESSPLVEEQYKQVTRDHDTALQFYNALLTKMNESSMATALEQRQQGEQFRVMDAPNLPDEPKFPNRSLFAGGGLAAGLLLGILIGALLEYRDTSLRNERDIWAFTKLPTLALISHMEDLPQTGNDRAWWKLFSRSTEHPGSAD